MEKTKKSKDQNVYANNVRKEEIHISEAKSGRHGYFCLGCDREMQAVISKISGRISYFRHDAIAMKGQPKCTYSDETYRHKLAKEILLRIKRVKVPDLYKYPPKNINGSANLICESQFIDAEFVEAELFFYENEYGDILWTKTIFSDTNKYLLLKPDITFFDVNMNPILLIEIEATHKISEEKALKLKRLGINTVQITIPKDSPENIEKTFETTNRTKWIYNYEQESTEYIPISDSNSKGISSIDEDQRKLFEESYNCRTAQINNLIRSITKCLESEQYGTTTAKLESDIPRVKRNTEEYRKSYEQLRDRYDNRIEELRNEIRERISSKNADRRKRIDTEKANLENEETEFRKFCDTENGRLETEFNGHRAGIERETIERYRKRRESIESERRELENRYIRERNGIESNREQLGQPINELTDQLDIEERNIERERKAVNAISARNNGIERARIELSKAEREQQRIEIQYCEKGIRLESQFNANRGELESRIRKLRDDFTEAVEKRANSGDGYTRRLKELYDDLSLAHDYVDAQSTFRRYRKASECFTNKSYKNWHDGRPFF